MILSGKKILSEVEGGHIRIDPFDRAQLNPVSYDLTLGERYRIYQYENVFRPMVLDSASQNGTSIGVMPEGGKILSPGIGYLMHTRERIWSDRYTAVVDGKSSLGRLFVQIHCTAGFIDPGFDGQVTLEVTVTHPVILYPGMRIAQVRFHPIDGEFELYRGHYTGEAAVGAVASRSWQQLREQKR